jgi:EAL domain-containing protein (putative c-di-GMP-specific phosphodiesterase class I)
MGIRVAIDDFGTGYSSLSYLQQFPVDTLKIDQSFVAGIVTNSTVAVLVDAVIGLGKSLRHRVVAEGVETPEQLEFLKNHHCTEAQGYFLSLPMPAAEFSALLKTGVSPDVLLRPASSQ